jgi:ATP-dependent RNA helicase RhlE
MPFESLGLRADLMHGVRRLGFTEPTSIQKEALPPALEGRDVLACAMTGSGKTAAFLLPILHRLADRPRRKTRALVLTPTRELAAQVDDHLRALAARTSISGAAVIGGVGMGSQEQAFRRGVDVVVATPGRLLDHLRFPYARLQDVEVLVLDEADRMLDMGFLGDIRRILRRVPTERQTLFFSATLPDAIQTLASEMLRDPVRISLGRKPAPAVGITQASYPVPADLKSALLVELLRRGGMSRVLAFTRTKHRANRLADYLGRHGVLAGRIHGNRSQSQRTQALGAFKAGRTPVLVATDIAARGIDVERLSHVVNFDVPACAEDYVHRVGRTARAGATGEALVFVSPEEEGGLRDIERALGARLPRVALDGFDYARSRKAEEPPAPAAPTRRGARRSPRLPFPRPHTSSRGRSGPSASASRGGSAW